MDATTKARWPLGWKLAFFVPLAVALTLTLIARAQADLHRQIELTIVVSAVLGFGIHTLLRAVR